MQKLQQPEGKGGNAYMLDAFNSHSESFIKRGLYFSTASIRLSPRYPLYHMSNKPAKVQSH